MNLNRIKKLLKRELTGVSEVPTKIDERDFSGRRPSQIVLRNSIGGCLFFIFLSVVLIIALTISIEADSNLVYLLFLIPLVLLVIGIVQFLDRKPQLIINKTGIWTPKFELTWEEIVSTKIRTEDGRSTYLVVVSECDEKIVDIGLLDISARYLSHQIELLKSK